MKIFADYHHAGAAQAIQLLFAERLGHEVYFPSPRLCQQVCELFPQKDGGKVWTFTSANSDTWAGVRHPENVHLIDSGAEFNATAWDMIIISRTESQEIIEGLLQSYSRRPDVPILAVNGNQGARYEWTKVFGLLTSDLAAFRLAPATLPKLHYCQEIGAHFMDRPFRPIEQRDLTKVNCLMNFLPNYYQAYEWDGDRNLFCGCPHCGIRKQQTEQPTRRMSPLTLWKMTRDTCKCALFFSYGKGCEYGNVSNAELPSMYAMAALIWHTKHIEGYGFSLLQSLAAGRLAIVQEGFYRYRTAGRFLVNGLTCFEVPWDPEAIAEKIEWYTLDLDRANRYARACYEAARGLMNWEHEAERVGEWLERIL